MRKRIVYKLFFMTFVLCCIVIATMIGGQYYFFKYIYIDKEKDRIHEQLEQYYTTYMKNPTDEHKLQNMESSYFETDGVMITTLDDLGTITKLPSGNFYIDIVNKGHNEVIKYHNGSLYTDIESTTDILKTSRINLNNLVNAGKHTDSNFSIMLHSLKNEITNSINFHFVSKDEHLNTLVPYSIRIGEYEGAFTIPYYDKIPRNPFRHEKFYGGYILDGIVKDIKIPNYDEIQPVYSNETFADRILQFQADLLMERIEVHEDKWHERELNINGIQYMESVRPIIKDGEITNFIYSLSSLHPLTKATDAMKGYYWYLIVLVLILTVIICLYYSRTITKPLLKINDATQKITDFQFDEKLSVTSKDELGVLASNINELSERMEGYIEKLKQDIEKEKKLEQVRKDFISGVSHELKTPLSVMQISASMLQDGIAPEKNEYYWNAIETEIEKMNVLVSEMLNLAKYESDTYQIEMEEVDISGVIENIHKKLQFQIEEKDLYVSLHVENITAVGKTHLLEQVVTNLFTNAIRYTDSKQRIIIHVKKEDNLVYVGIENKGAHLPDESLEKIWDQFYRIDASRKRVNGGTGLGLPIVKRILQLHGAQYGAQNTSDGVLFYFYLNEYKSE
ncbi:ATP-binding protein [Bacillus manliponensis]|uniref:sensor histidine kinase n=1 Tax=Bacillus manliponensis TaxID=574376 RepID=UPI003515E961